MCIWLQRIPHRHPPLRRGNCALPLKKSAPQPAPSAAAAPSHLHPSRLCGQSSIAVLGALEHSFVRDVEGVRAEVSCVSAPVGRPDFDGCLLTQDVLVQQVKLQNMAVLELVVPGLLHGAILLPLHPDHHVRLLVGVTTHDHVHGGEGDDRGCSHLIHRLREEAVVEVEHLRLAVVLLRAGPSHRKERIPRHLRGRLAPHDLKIPLLLPTVAEGVQQEPVQSPGVVPAPANQGAGALADQRSTPVDVDAAAGPAHRVVVVRVQQHGRVHGAQRHQLLHEKPLQVLQGLMHPRAVDVIHVGNLGRLALGEQVALHRLREMVHPWQAPARSIQRPRGHGVHLGLRTGRVGVPLRGGRSNQGVVHKAPHAVGAAYLSAGAFSLESRESPSCRPSRAAVGVGTRHQLLG
mmetsp:Transcript_28591/g.69064  ORF Transcript_28591/g.69064 Transcript_28591/m.69064 type:complete len:405 (-) Transcript_28591:1267-2481(-)